MRDFLDVILELFLAACVAVSLMMLVSCASKLSPDEQYYKRLWSAYCNLPSTGNAAQDAYFAGRCQDSQAIGGEK